MELNRKTAVLLILLSVMFLPLAVLAKTPGGTPAKSKPTASKARPQSYQGEILAINGTDYTIAIISRDNGKQLESNATSTLIAHVQAKSESKIKAKKPASLAKLKNSDEFMAKFNKAKKNKKVAKVGDKVSVSGLLNADGSLGKAKIAVISAGKRGKK